MSARRRDYAEEEETLGTTAFYVPPECFSGERVVFPDSELEHLVRVLRQGPGCLVEVLDGAGGCHQVRLEKEGASLVGRVLESRREDMPPMGLSAAVALGRKERMRFAVEKLAELGCHRIFPLVTDYVSFSGDPSGLEEKLRLTCVAALKQSRRRWLTRVEDTIPFGRFLEMCAESGPEPVFCLKKTQSRVISGRNRLRGKREYCLVVGPEGGFSPAEMEAVGVAEFPCLDLGEYHLRFETAAVAGLVVLWRMLRDDFGILWSTGSDVR